MVKHGTGRKIKDETGARYGLLTVIEQAGFSNGGAALWRCRCDCGTEKIVSGPALRFGVSVSCGCRKTDPKAPGSYVKDETGKRYGHWFVVSIATKEQRRGRPAVWWLCRCDCGTERVIAGAQLRDHRTQSCGCSNREKRLQGRAASFSRALYGYRRGAKIRKLAFDITEEQAQDLFLAPCFYCGAEPAHIHENKRCSSFARNGIDRIDSTGPYCLDNCVSCCTKCNLMKRDMEVQDFWTQCVKIADRYVDHCRRVTEHQARLAAST